MVMLGVMCSKKKSYVLLFRKRNETYHIIIAVFQFLKIAAFESFPSMRVVTKPVPQIWTGRNVLKPHIHVQVRLTDTARPKAINQNAKTICCINSIVDTLHCHFRSNRFHHIYLPTHQ
ncbi:hypothetical protein AD945_02595 [Gluconobacter albidus]|uniref:Uncharacterized protein n=1 Tax=Gluconobacter albidus TaxID=318683 RepID=A0A149TM64_9PROT|nr:hypothetical protein AD945_02595 [Gluconobacter albidus]